MVTATGMATATAEALGEATERTAEYLKTQRAMQGVSPFDKSLGAATVFANELRVMTVANDLYAKGLGFTSTQLQELGREHVRLTEQFKVQGKDLKGLDAEFNNIVSSAKQVTDAENSMAISMKLADKASNDAGKANNFLAREMQRVDSVLTGFNDNLNVTSSNRLMKFREQLKLSGTDAATAANMLKVYEEKLKTINAVGQSKAKNSREEELRYLARATSVQLGDIGISLAGGQNPLLVLIQQGDQLRGVLNQVSANGQEMQRALSMAFSQIVTGSKDVVMALGSFVVGAFVDAGKAVTKFGADLLGISKAMEIWNNNRFAAWAAEGEAGFTKISNSMKTANTIMTVFGMSLGALTAFAAASAVALLQVTNANDDLSRSLVATGARFGLTTEAVQNLAGSLSGIGSTRVDVLNAFNEISKSGTISADSISKVAEAALKLESVGGPAVKETTALFGKLKEDSVETLIKYAEQTGLVTVSQIEWIKSLAETKGQIVATKEVTELLSKAILQQAADTYASLSSMGRLWVNIKTSTNDAWGAMQNFAASEAILTPIVRVLETVLLTLTNVALVFTSLVRLPVAMATATISAASAIKDFVTGTLSAKEALSSVKNTVLSIVDTEKERIAGYKDLTDKIKSEGKYSKENAKSALESSAKLNQENSLGATQLRKEFELQKKLKEELEKLDTKSLTKQQFLNKAVESYGKIVGGTAKLSAENLKNIEKIAAAEWDKANKPKKQPKSDAMKGAEDTANWYKKSIERIDDLKNKTIGAIEQLSKAQVLLMDLGDDDQFRKLSAQQQMRLVDRINEIDLLEKEISLKKEQERVEKALVKIKDEGEKFTLKEQANIEKIISSSQLRLELPGKTADEQFAITEKYELQNKLNEVGLRFDQQRLKIKQEYEKIEPKTPEDKKRADEAYAAAIAEVNKQEAATRDSLMVESASKFEAEYLKKVFNVGKTLSDAITTALFEGGQAGTKKLKDYIVGVFREKINVSINAVVNSVIGSVFGGGGSGGNASNSGSSAGGLLSSIFGGGSGGSGSGGIMQTLGSLVSFTGTGFGAGLGATLGGVGTMGGLSAGASLVGTGTLAGATSGIGMMAGAAAPWIAGAMLLKDLMAYKVESKGNGITATLGGANGLPSGQVGTYQEFQQTGGLGGGGTTTNRDWGVAGSGVTGYIANSVKTITASNKAYAKALGLTSDSIDTFTKNIEVNLTGLDAAGQQAAIDAALASFSAEQATAAYGAALAGVTREGETTTQTLTRLGTDLTSVNAMFGDLGYTLYDVSVTGAAAASRLVSAFGSLAAAQQQMNSYYENFYSQSEQEANIYRSVQSDLAGAGMNFTVEQLQAATRGDIRSAVDSLAGDVGTEQGANRYATAVKAANRLAGIKSNNTPAPSGPTGPQPGTSEYYKPGGEVSGGSASAGNEAADSIANAWQAIVDSIWGEVKRIRELFNGTGKDALAAAKAEFEKATAMARSGDQEAAKVLPELSQTMLTLAQGQASTLIELRRAQALTANSLEQTITGIASQYGAVVPTFASGGNYAGGMALVGEEGPELINFNQGGYVHTAGQTASMLGGNGDLLREIRRLNDKVDQLEAAAISTAISNSKLLKILERVTPNGTTVEVSGTVTAV